MTMILSQENWKKCVIYLDDVLILGKTLEEHNNRLDLILARIKEAGLKLSPEKCRILQTKIHYLGHVISEEGVSTDPEKIESKKIGSYQLAKRRCRYFWDSAIITEDLLTNMRNYPNSLVR